MKIPIGSTIYCGFIFTSWIFSVPSIGITNSLKTSKIGWQMWLKKFCVELHFSKDSSDMLLHPGTTKLSCERFRQHPFFNVVFQDRSNVFTDIQIGRITWPLFITKEVDVVLQKVLGSKRFHAGCFVMQKSIQPEWRPEHFESLEEKEWHAEFYEASESHAMPSSLVLDETIEQLPDS